METNLDMLQLYFGYIPEQGMDIICLIQTEFGDFVSQGTSISTDFRKQWPTSVLPVLLICPNSEYCRPVELYIEALLHPQMQYLILQAAVVGDCSAKFRRIPSHSTCAGRVCAGAGAAAALLACMDSRSGRFTVGGAAAVLALQLSRAVLAERGATGVAAAAF
jgi:hypothetical protein